jgi:hypothetical protein
MNIWNYINTDTRVSHSSDWCGTDSEARWLENQHKPELDYYRHNPVRYDMNNQYFRSQYDYMELSGNQTEVDVFLGCSHTVGVGLPEHLTWTSGVSHHTGRTPVNLALPGSGCEWSLVALMRWRDLLNIRAVYHFQPIYARYLYKTGDASQHALTSNTFVHLHPDQINDNFIARNKSDQGYIELSHYRNVKAIQQLCSEHDAEYWHSDGSRLSTELQVDLYNPDVLTESDIPARDLQHFPVSWHEQIAEHFIDQAEPLDWQLDDQSLNY